jgi:hypothetical protein
LIGVLSLSVTFLSGGWQAALGQDQDTAAAPSITAIKIVPDVNQPISTDGGKSLNPTLLPVGGVGAEQVSAEEHEIYFKSLKLASQTPLGDLKESASRFQEERRRSNPKYKDVDEDHFPQFYDLVENPDVYRGHAVSLRGTLRRLTKLDAGKNAAGISTIYEGWLYTADSQSNPTVVIFTEKPSGLELGSDITEEVRATGYFYKVYRYEAQNGPSTAPMLLAGTLELNPGPRHFVFQPMSPVIYLVIAAVLAVLGYSIWKGGQPKRIESLLPPEEPKF